MTRSTVEQPASAPAAPTPPNLDMKGGWPPPFDVLPAGATDTDDGYLYPDWWNMPTPTPPPPPQVAPVAGLAEDTAGQTATGDVAVKWTLYAAPADLTKITVTAYDKALGQAGRKAVGTVDATPTDVKAKLAGLSGYPQVWVEAVAKAVAGKSDADPTVIGPLTPKPAPPLQPKTTADPTTLAAGALITVDGTDFPSGETVTVELFKGTSGGTALATREPTLTPQGTFKVTDLKVPEAAEAGAYRVSTTVDGYTVPDIAITVTA